MLEYKRSLIANRFIQFFTISSRNKNEVGWGYYSRFLDFWIIFLLCKDNCKKAKYKNRRPNMWWEFLRYIFAVLTCQNVGPVRFKYKAENFCKKASAIAKVKFSVPMAFGLTVLANVRSSQLNTVARNSSI